MYVYIYIYNILYLDIPNERIYVDLWSQTLWLILLKCSVSLFLYLSWTPHCPLLSHYRTIKTLQGNRWEDSHGLDSPCSPPFPTILRMTSLNLSQWYPHFSWLKSCELPIFHGLNLKTPMTSTMPHFLRLKPCQIPCEILKFQGFFSHLLRCELGAWEAVQGHVAGPGEVVDLGCQWTFLLIGIVGMSGMSRSRFHILKRL